MEAVIEIIAEVIFGIVFEVFIEGGVDFAKDKKYSPWIRFPIVILGGIIYFGILALIILEGFSVLEDSLLRAIVIWLFALAYIVASVWTLHDEYKKRKKKR